MPQRFGVWRGCLNPLALPVSLCSIQGCTTYIGASLAIFSSFRRGSSPKVSGSKVYRQPVQSRCIGHDMALGLPIGPLGFEKSSGNADLGKVHHAWFADDIFLQGRLGSSLREHVWMPVTHRAGRCLPTYDKACALFSPSSPWFEEWASVCQQTLPETTTGGADLLDLLMTPRKLCNG
ncbi:hypothetical protein QBC44DRAFT_10854 [Cladorrhinum sp. PSN332]|nr:hypothetical protein QBC44DRAFT_10854 [Cladorrhinum sp. PSN332]